MSVLWTIGEILALGVTTLHADPFGAIVTSLVRYTLFHIVLVFIAPLVK